MKISTILDHIDSGYIALPKFQRGYVWNRDQVRALIDRCRATDEALKAGYFKHSRGPNAKIRKATVADYSHRCVEFRIDCLIDQVRHV